MAETTRRTGAERVGGRSARVVEAVLSAALRELTRSGYDDFRVDAVAQAAGVNKTSVYRRWPTKLMLVAAALRARELHTRELPNYGSVRTDLVAALEAVNDYLSTYNYRDLAALFRSEKPDPERESVLRALREEYYAKQSELIERAIRRGELPPDTDARFMCETLYVGLTARVMRDMQPLSRDIIERMVELVVTGAEHHGALKHGAPQK
jgi:AcrR family transcriptional regulator